MVFFRGPCDAWEAASVASAEQREALFPAACRRRVLLTHMRPEVAMGHLWPLLGDVASCRALGYRNRGGTFDEAGMLFANGCSWAHVLQGVAEVLGVSPEGWLSAEERAALAGRGDPRCLR